mgnify:CR=1 FL=1
MSKMIFVNLPVADLPKAMAFYSALGFTNNPHFTDETAACMVSSREFMPMRILSYLSLPAPCTAKERMAARSSSTHRAPTSRMETRFGRSPEARRSQRGVIYDVSCHISHHRVDQRLRA